MKPKRATFVTSAAEPRQFPPPERPEVAFAGRSNVGKSTLLNALVGHHKLARTSNTPGRTRLVNWFRVERDAGDIDFVDLPGYGYARVSKAMREAWRPLIEAYLVGRDVLRGVVLLIDARRGARGEEIELLEWLAAEEIPAIVVMTKSDKLAKSKRKPAAAALRRDLGLSRDPVICAAQDGTGIDQLWKHILRLVSAGKSGGQQP